MAIAVYPGVDYLKTIGLRMLDNTLKNGIRITSEQVFQEIIRLELAIARQSAQTAYEKTEKRF